MRTQGPRLAVTVVIVGVLAVAVWLGGGPRPSPGSTPSDLIYESLLPAMRAGDARAWLGCFGPPLREQMQAAVEREGYGAFGRTLQTFQSKVTGVAIPNRETTGDRAVLTVEWVYQVDRDVQQVELKRDGARWRIVSMSSQERSAMDVPWGTPVLQ